MKRTRRNFSISFKTKVVLEALKERHTLAELATHFDIHPTQITTWKKQFLDNASQAFDSEAATEELHQAHKELDELYKQVGRMKMENEWLKKKLP